MPRKKTDNTSQLNVRVAPKDVERLDNLVDAISNSTLPTNRSEVLRAAVREGLAVLEPQYGLVKGGRPEPKKRVK